VLRSEKGQGLTAAHASLSFANDSYLQVFSEPDAAAAPMWMDIHVCLFGAVEHPRQMMSGWWRLCRYQSVRAVQDIGSWRYGFSTALRHAWSPGGGAQGDLPCFVHLAPLQNVEARTPVALG
jgi:hypothetical protein